MRKSRGVFSALALLLAAVLLAGCGQKSANLQEDAVAPDKTLYENGQEYLQKNQFIKARLAFQTLINTYGDSEYAPSAYLAIADSYYREGGTEALLQAESQYKDFIIFYPTHEMADDAQLRVAAVNYKLMNAPDRDPTYTRKAAAELKRFIDNYPDSELFPTAEFAFSVVQENEAKGIQGIGEFYYRKKSNRAAEMRYKEVLERFPEFSQLDRSLYRLGQTLMRQDRTEEASVYFSRIASGFPFSDYFDESKKMLELLEKPVPEIDQAEAERRLANLPAETDGFSFNPLKMIMDIFSGREDLYEVARKQAEARAMALAKAEEERSNQAKARNERQTKRSGNR